MKIMASICLLLLLIFFTYESAIAKNTATNEVTVGTYQYPEIDRKAAVMPLSDLIKSLSDVKVNIVVAKTPSALAKMFRDGKIQVSVPNLIGFIESADDTSQFMAIARCTR